MPARMRFLFFLFFIFIFIILIPVAILYSTGYRLTKDFSLQKTGGIYVFYPESGAEVYLDGSLSQTTSLFYRGIFISNLKAQSYDVMVTKPGYRSWNKKIDVKAQRVAEGYPYLIPQDIATSSIPKFISNDYGSESNPLYKQVTLLFAATTSVHDLSSTSTVRSLKGFSTTSPYVSAPFSIAATSSLIRNNIEIVKDGGWVKAVWLGSEDSTPFLFCDEERVACQDSVDVMNSDGVKRVDFYQGRNDVILFSKPDGIYITELDTRTPQNTFELLSGSNLDFRTYDQRVFIKDRASIYELLLTPSASSTNQLSS